MFKGPTKNYRQGCFTYFISSGQIMTPESVRTINRKLQDPNTDPDFLSFAASSKLFQGYFEFIKYKDKDIPNRVHFSRRNLERLIKYKFNQSLKDNFKKRFASGSIRSVIADYFNEVKIDNSLTEDQKFDTW